MALSYENIFNSILWAKLWRVTLLEICVGAEMTQPHGWE